MPIEHSETGLKLYYAIMNEDGTWGELIPPKGDSNYQDRMEGE